MGLLLASPAGEVARARGFRLAALQCLVCHAFCLLDPSAIFFDQGKLWEVFLRGDVALRDGFGRTALETAQDYGKRDCAVRELSMIFPLPADFFTCR